MNSRANPGSVRLQRLRLHAALAHFRIAEWHGGQTQRVELAADGQVAGQGHDIAAGQHGQEGGGMIGHVGRLDVQPGIGAGRVEQLPHRVPWSPSDSGSRARSRTLTLRRPASACRRHITA